MSMTCYSTVPSTSPTKRTSKKSPSSLSFHVILPIETLLSSLQQNRKNMCATTKRKREHWKARKQRKKMKKAEEKWRKSIPASNLYSEHKNKKTKEEKKISSSHHGKPNMTSNSRSFCFSLFSFYSVFFFLLICLLSFAEHSRIWGKKQPATDKKRETCLEVWGSTERERFRENTWTFVELDTLKIGEFGTVQEQKQQQQKKKRQI